MRSAGVRGLLRRHWLVMDMDGTCVPTPSKSGGHYPSLAHSRCKEQLVRWIQHGGSVALLSTAGKRMWVQAYEELKDALFPAREGDIVGRLVLCGFSGAALFQSDRSARSMLEDVRYRESALGEGKGTCVPLKHVDAIKSKCLDVVRTFFARAAEDPTLIAALSRKYHGPFGELLEQRRSSGAEWFHANLLDDVAPFIHGRYLKETNDALIDTQTVPGTDPPVLVQLTILGIPMARFDEFFPETLVQEFNELGVYVKKQPNSVVVAPHGVDKGTSIRWLVEHAADFDSFDLTRAIAFGDFPATVDLPMTKFPPMPFVSLSKTPELNPPGVIHVGSEEDGSAAFLDELLSALERGARGLEENSLFDRKMLEAAAKDARRRLEAATLPLSDAHSRASLPVGATGSQL